MEEQSTQILEIQKIDIATSAMKSAVGILPIVGPFLVELVGLIIPNQRFDRIVKYASQLEEKLHDVDRKTLKFALQNENFTDLMEESIRQAARSLSDERREYLAAIIKNSLTTDSIAFNESKHILRILGEINDIEVIWLRFYLNPVISGDEDFRKKHMAIIEPIDVYMGAPQSIVDKSTLRESYKEHLVQLGLLSKIFEIDRLTRIPTQKMQGYQITSLGKMVLRQIDLF